MGIQYIHVCESVTDELVELPCEEDDTMLLTTLTSQFPGACGLKFRNPDTESMRGLRLVDGRFQPPEKGWEQHDVYYCVFPKGDKRKGDDSSEVSRNKKSDKNQKCSDLIVLGLPWKTTEVELREYFEQFGEVLMVQVKKDAKSGLSKGFGFVRFSDYDVQMRVIAKRHNIDGRWCDVRIPLSRGDGGFNYQSSEFNRKIFVGRLSEDISTEDLKEYFSKYGEIADVFIPKPFRAFAFVTFYDSEVAQALCGEDHIIKGVSVHVSNAVPKVDLSMSGFGGPMNSSPHGGYGSSGHLGMSNGGGMSSMGGHPRYSHQPYHYSAYDTRRSASHSSYSNYGSGSGGSGSPQIWSGGPMCQYPVNHRNDSMQNYTLNQQSAALQLAAAALAGQRMGSGNHGGTNRSPGSKNGTNVQDDKNMVGGGDSGEAWKRRYDDYRSSGYPGVFSSDVQRQSTSFINN